MSKIEEQMGSFKISGNIVDLVKEIIFKGSVHIENGHVKSIIADESVTETQFVLPGLIDSHIHIESSMLIPSEFAGVAATHGTVATVSDPHEIANVLGLDGIRYMLESSKYNPLSVYFTLSSCVPATEMETSGSRLRAFDIFPYFTEKWVVGLAEMMNYPGVLFRPGRVGQAKSGQAARQAH